MSTTSVPGHRAGTRPLTTAEILALPATIDLVTAGRALGIGRTAVHTMARRGELPFVPLRIGRRYRVRRADLLGLLGLTADGVESR